MAHKERNARWLRIFAMGERLAMRNRARLAVSELAVWLDGSLLAIFCLWRVG